MWNSIKLVDDILFREWVAPDDSHRVLQILVPSKLIPEILSQNHDSPSGGHFGINKTLQKIRKKFYWASCKLDVENWCRKCTVCFSKKGPNVKGKAEMKIFNVGFPFERVGIDILGPLPRSSSGNRFILVVTDYFTRWPEAIALKDQKAITVAEALIVQVFSRFGLPYEIHSDQGRNCESTIFKEVMNILGIRKTRTTPLHPQSNGLVERLNRKLLQYLSKFLNKNQRDWDKWVPMFLLAYRSSQHETTEYSPAIMMLGRELSLPFDLVTGRAPFTKESLGFSDFVVDFRNKLNKIQFQIQNYNLKAVILSFKPGQKV
jgi:hypothetical protein